MFLILTHHFKFSSQKHDTVISIFLRSPKKKNQKVLYNSDGGKLYPPLTSLIYILSNASRKSWISDVWPFESTI